MILGFPLVRRRTVVVAVAAFVTTLAGCANPFSAKALDNFSLTYRINIQQGVVVTQEMADQLNVGMTKDQVRFVLGTPILTDPFHANRWDYPFRFQPGRGAVEERRFTVYFADDKLTGYNGDSLPTEEEFAKQPELRDDAHRPRSAAGRATARPGDRDDVRHQQHDRHAGSQRHAGPAVGAGRPDADAADDARRLTAPTSEAMLRIAVAGASGRMGRMLIDAVARGAGPRAVRCVRPHMPASATPSGRRSTTRSPSHRTSTRRSP